MMFFHFDVYFSSYHRTSPQNKMWFSIIGFLTTGTINLIWCQPMVYVSNIIGTNRDTGERMKRVGRRED